ncbi:MAG: FAD binding domain-containing protein [Sneathiellaceae bacterium]
MAAYFRPPTLAEALSLLAPARALPGLAVVAGGTDHYAARAGRPPAPAILDITGIPALGAVERSADGWRIGATARWSDIHLHPDLPPVFDALRAAAGSIGSVQIRNAGTVAGNICGAAATADGIPPLLAMDALVELQDLAGSRRCPLASFVAGGQAGLRPGELVTAILVPHREPPDPAGCSAFGRLAARRHLAPVIANLAVVLHLSGGRVAAAGIAVGGCGAQACRLPALETALQGRRLAAGLAGLAETADLAPLAPVDDALAPAAYRRAAVPVLLRRLLLELAGDGRGAAA